MATRFFAWFKSTLSKSRENFLSLLRAGEEDYCLSDAALDYMDQQKLGKSQISRLQKYRGRVFDDSESWQQFLNTQNITSKRHRRIATEGALMGSVLRHHFCQDLVIVSDGAGQFNILNHALCWIHAERLVHKTHPLNAQHREDIAKVRGDIWDFYRALKAFGRHPREQERSRLRERFDEIFTFKTRFATLNQLLKRIHQHKEEMLLVLDHPDIPLYTNGSETDIRDYVKKRKISGGTRSDLGRRCRDTFISLKKTSRKLGISFWDFLKDRLCHPMMTIPALDALIRQRGLAPGY